jgi:hypothetical protein
MTNLNRNLVEAYKIHLFEAVSREMMVEPSPEPQGMAPPGWVDNAVKWGKNLVRDSIDNFHFIRAPAWGLPAWMRDLYRLGKLTYNDLRYIFRDANGNYYMLEGTNDPDVGGYLRLIEQCDTCPSGWKYTEGFTPYGGSLGGKKIPGLQQYTPRQIGGPGDNAWGGWGKPKNWLFGVGGAAGSPYITNPDLYPDWDLNGDGIPDNIQSQEYMQ